MTCLPPSGQTEEGVLREVWDAVRDDEASLVEGRRGGSGRPRCVRWFRFAQKALTDRLVDTEAVHGPVPERGRPQSQVGHQALRSGETGQELTRKPIVSHELELTLTQKLYVTKTHHF